MIKINLLPPHILERRRVKIVAVLMALLLLATAAIMILIVFSLRSQVTSSKEALTKATAEATEVTSIKENADALRGSFQGKSLWVGFVDSADRYPQAWVKWFQRINRWIPDELVINSLPPPNNNILTLQGSTSDYRAANRLWHNLMRCDLLAPSAGPNVTVNPLMPGPSGGANPRMAYPVTVTMNINGAYTQFMTFGRPQAPPSMGGVAPGAAAGGRMGRGPGGAPGGSATGGRGRQGMGGGPGEGPRG